MFKISIGAFVILAASTFGASAQTSTDPATAGVAAPPADATSDTSGQNENNQVVCRQEKVTGTLIPSQVCHTRHEWDVMRQRSQELLRGVQLNRSFNNSLPGTGSK